MPTLQRRNGAGIQSTDTWSVLGVSGVVGHGEDVTRRRSWTSLSPPRGVVGERNGGMGACRRARARRVDSANDGSGRGRCTHGGVYHLAAVEVPSLSFLSFPE